MIHNQEFFDGSLPADFDGLFDWDALSRWSLPRFGAVDFMDIDAVIEKNGRFLHVETKSKGSKIPAGQTITIRTYHSLGVITYVIIYFDSETKDDKYIDKVGVMYPNDDNPHYLPLKDKSYAERFATLCTIVREWYRDAENMGDLSIRKDLQKPKVAPVPEPETLLHQILKFFKIC